MEILDELKLPPEIINKIKLYNSNPCADMIKELMEKELMNPYTNICLDFKEWGLSNKECTEGMLDLGHIQDCLLQHPKIDGNPGRFWSYWHDEWDRFTNGVETFDNYTYWHNMEWAQHFDYKSDEESDDEEFDVSFLTD